jgi:hypothetical protein|nr:MAG TPA: HemY protein N-terminus [Caudoviricetes sp.]
MLNFISFIIVVVSVLQIVLFFKIWKMTNDVRKIKKKIDADLEIDRTDKIRIALLKGDKQKAIELLTDKLATELVRKSNEEYMTPDEISALKEKYAKEFLKLGVNELPIKDVKEQSDIYSLMKRL